MKTYIYALIDNDGNIGYVGKSDYPYKRLSAHIRENRITPKTIWIKSLKIKPSIIILDEVEKNNWIFWEKHWICLIKSFGFTLTNISKGGNGSDNLTVEHKNKISKKVKEFHKNNPKFNLTPEHTKSEIKISKEILEDLYINQNKTLNEIANMFNCVNSTIYKKIKSYGIEKNKDKIWEVNKIKSKPVLKFTLDGIFLKEYESLSKASEDMGDIKFYIGQISRCCLGKSKTGYGFLWKFKSL